MNTDKFRIRLRELRKENKLSIEKLSELCDLSKNCIGFYERGITIPRIDNLIKIAEVLNVSTDYLIGVDNKNEY